MARKSVTRCALREVSYRTCSSSTDRTVTVRCTVDPESGTGSADGYGTAESEAVARKKAFSEAVERLLACTPFALEARPPTPPEPRPAPDPLADGVRAAPENCRVRRYRSLAGDGTVQVPMFWSSPWVSDVELRSATLWPSAARLSSTIGWAVAPSAQAALRGALLELTELLNYGTFLYQCLRGAPESEVPQRDSGQHDGVVRTVPIGFVSGTPTVLAITRHQGRLMPATGVGAASTLVEATERAVLELAQAEVLWRSNQNAPADERLFMRRFDRWPLVRRCVALDFDLIAGGVSPDPSSRWSPLRELTAGGIETWADSGAVELSGPGVEAIRVHFAHVVARPQPLLGLVRAGIPVFETGEVRKILDRSRRPRPRDRGSAERAHGGRHPAGA
ncbi:hypothetical protein OOZ19_02950 [Saccharopolyspora sp. NFXS83]|uniref:hypothetical protein n=1 Tax=Saccharopolyspora sp. NFXS83 TaxID=2993560 RepID=UPI00224AC809|nr:hypothetical protein [Saccharopolyspora sp. NFXS83]MCX2729187.1 hypothetical protein [Saccharopolyspora sp. NFXS83]